MGSEKKSNITEQQVVDYLSAVHEHPLIHFEYDKGVYYVIYGPNRTEGYTGKGKSIGDAIYDMIGEIAKEDDGEDV